MLKSLVLKSLVLRSSTSTVTRRTTGPETAAERPLPAAVLDLTARLTPQRLSPPETLHITPELLAALDGSWRRH